MYLKYITHPEKIFSVQAQSQPFHAEKTQLRATSVSLKINQKLRSYSFIKLPSIVKKDCLISEVSEYIQRLQYWLHLYLHPSVTL